MTNKLHLPIFTPYAGREVNPPCPAHMIFSLLRGMPRLRMTRVESPSLKAILGFYGERHSCGSPGSVGCVHNVIEGLRCLAACRIDNRGLPGAAAVVPANTRLFVDVID